MLFVSSKCIVPTPTNPPLIAELKLVEQIDRGLADIVAGNGSGTIYGEYVLENGDKLFDRRDQVIERRPGKFTSINVGQLTSGTGTLAGVKGSVQAQANFEPKSGLNESQTSIEYTLAK
jgi:hypothetical protein